MKVSLGELIGAKAASQGMSLDNLEDIFGEKVPELPRNTIGKFRLRNALRQRFGDEYANIKGVKQLLSDFDEEVRFAGVIHDLKKVGKKKEEK